MRVRHVGFVRALFFSVINNIGEWCDYELDVLNM